MKPVNTEEKVPSCCCSCYHSPVNVMIWGDLLISVVITSLEPTNKQSDVSPFLMLSSLGEQWHLLYFQVVAHKN